MLLVLSSSTLVFLLMLECLTRSERMCATTPRYISWIRYHDANKSLVWKPNTEAVNATTSERAAIICSMGSRILSTQLSPSSLAYSPKIDHGGRLPWFPQRVQSLRSPPWSHLIQVHRTLLSVFGLLTRPIS
ncbi:Uncharacterized protein HZ326_17581 [Fusarium oxysporum f. sp. albedinis]|nr:Uncharacterized protein HZ326_17581 [Fusarium oxysporum f. sp. albedinis]